MGAGLDPLDALAGLAEEAGASSVAQDARSLLERVREGRFFVACLGQFKRGKSTLINALLGEELLPHGVTPVTSVVTVVRFGTRRARVRLGADTWLDVAVEELAQFVAEAENPENRKGVTGVEVFCPSPFLEHGLCLVDTPGIGSVFAGNTAETEAFVPHVDAAIVVLGGDPPISGDELELVEAVAARVPQLFFVLNKADRLSEADLREARVFTAKVLSERLHRESPDIFAVSALERLRGRGPERQWRALLACIDELAREGGTELVARSAARGLEALVERLGRHLTEEREALLRPVEESERRVELLRRCAKDAEQAAVELKHLFNAAQEKLSRRFDEERERFVSSTLPLLSVRLDERLARVDAMRGPKLRRQTLAEAQDAAEELVRAWMDEQRPIAEREFASVTERFVEHANAFLERLRAEGQLPPGSMPTPLVPETGLRARVGFCFEPFMWLTTPPFWLWFADWFRSERGAQASARKAGLALARRLLETNASRVVGDFHARVIESRRGVESALRRTLREIVTTAEEALGRAKDLQQRGGDAVRKRLVEVDGQSRRLADLTSGSIVG